MQIENARFGGSLVIRVAGHLDAVNAPLLQSHCQQAIDQGERAMVLDLATLDYVSSAGLRSILIVAKSMSAAGGEFAVANVRGLVRKVFEVSGFLGMVRCLDSLDAPAAQQ